MVKRLLIISLLWGGLILILCSVPGSSLPGSPRIPHFDKLVHAGLYFVLSILLLPLFDLSKQRYFNLAAPFIIILITFIYGGIIEIAQEKWFINRSGDYRDLLSDIAGGLLAIIIYYLFLRKFIKKRFSGRLD